MGLFERTVSQIETEYNQSKNDLGWRFLNCSKKSLTENTGYALITLNPGGDKEDSNQGRESCESGHSYLAETWVDALGPGKAPLQKQFQSLFQQCEKYSDFPYPAILEKSISGYFIPFRSTSFSILKDKKASLDFSSEIWFDILSETKPKIIFCIDRETYRHLSNLMKKIYGAMISTKEHPTGWGNFKASVSVYPNSKLIRFPHLSRFSIFGREASKEPLELIYRDIFLNNNPR